MPARPSALGFTAPVQPAPVMPAPGTDAGGAASVPGVSAAATNAIMVVFRAVDRSQFNANANSDLAYITAAEFLKSSMIDTNVTALAGSISAVETNNGTYTFPMTIKLKRPLKL
jgi:hypothetical protein